MLKSLWRAETGIFLGIWLVLLMAGRTKMFGDPGTFWHVVVGRQILTSGELPTKDTFTFPWAGQPWIAQQWLGECFMAWIHDHIGGLDTLLLAAVTLLAAFYTWVAHRLIRVGIHWLLALLVVAFAIFSSANHLHPRPHLVNIAFLGLTFGLLCDYEAGRIGLKRLFWLVPLYVIWTNIHGGMVGGVGTLGVAAAGWAGAWLIGWESPLGKDRRSAARSLMAMALLITACAAAAPVNPYGTDMIRVWFSLIGSKVLPEMMIEHFPLRHAGSSGIAVLSFAAVYLLVFLGTMPCRPRVCWVIPLVWLALAWQTIRHGPLFAVTAAIAIGEMYPHVRWVKWLERRGSTVFPLRSPPARARPPWVPYLIPTVLVATALLLQARSIVVPVLGRDWVKLEPRHWPVDLLPELRAYEAEHPPGTPIFNDMLFGGFLIYYTPNLRVFIDDRCELYGDKGLQDYADTLSNRPETIEAWAREYGFEMALTAPGSDFDNYLHTAPGWSCVGSTSAANLYRKASPIPNPLPVNPSVKQP
jgi:hypothetical protein